MLHYDESVERPRQGNINGVWTNAWTISLGIKVKVGLIDSVHNDNFTFESLDLVERAKYDLACNLVKIELFLVACGNIDWYFSVCHDIGKTANRLLVASKGR